MARTNVPQNVHLISRKWGHSVSSLAHNIQSSNPNVLSRALIIICNCSMKKTILLQWNTLLTSGWADITNLFPGDQLKWTITIFSFLNNSLKERMKKNQQPAGQKKKRLLQLGITVNKCERKKRKKKRISISKWFFNFSNEVLQREMIHVRVKTVLVNV